MRGSQAWIMTFLVTGLSALLTLAASPVTRNTGPFMVFTVGVLICASWTASFWYPFLSSVLAALFVNYFLVSPNLHFLVNQRELLRSVVWLSFSNGLVLLLRKVRKSEIQALKAREKELEVRSVLERLIAVHRAAQIGTWDWNLQTNELVWSDETYRIHGLAPEQFNGRMAEWTRFVHPEDLPGVLAVLRAARKTGKESRSEFRVIWPNGETHWLCGRGQVIMDDRGNPVRMVGISKDITQRRREDEALRRSEKRNAATRLAAILAHEINNPLQGLTNLLYLMSRDRDNKRETLDLLDIADHLLDRMRRIAKQTLVLYRESGTREAVDLVQILEELLTICEPQVAAKQLRIQKEYASVAAIHALRGELSQAFSNLLANAIDASPHGGTLILRVKQLESSDANPVKTVRVEVEDFGVGIPPEDRQRVFEPFFTTKSESAGLGLWASSQIVETHGGTIEFRSGSPDGKQGTCFSVVLPIESGIARAA